MLWWLPTRLPEWRRLKALVLDSVSSPITRRVYNLGLDEFIAWYAGAAARGIHEGDGYRLASVTRGPKARPYLDQCRITAVRKAAVEAADNGLLA